MYKNERNKKSFEQKKIFNNLNLEINKGEVFALLGPNGVEDISYADNTPMG